MHVILRPAEPEDLPALRNLFLDARRDTFHWMDSAFYKLEDYDAACAGESQVVAESDGVVIGFASWWPPENFLHHLYVAANSRRQGIGRLLLDQCLKSMGRPAQLKCVIRNADALRFYESCGWRAVGTGKDVEGDYLLLQLD